MSQARWLTITFAGLVLGASFLFRLVYPTDAAVSDAKWSLRLGRVDPLVHRIDQLAKTIEARPEACIDLAWQLVALGRRPAAERLLDTVWQANPFQAQLGEALVAVHLSGGNLAAAAAVLDQMNLRGLPLSPEGRKMRASWLVQTGNFPEAEKALNQIIADEPTNAGALVQLGNVFDSQQRFAEAAAEFRHAMAIDKDDPQTGLSLARALAWDAMQDARRTIRPSTVIAHD